MDTNTNKTEYVSERKRKKFNIIPILIIAAVIVGWGLIQAYLVNYNKVDTVKATEGYINDSIISQGIICREEVVLTRTSGGVVDYLVSDGERVTKGALVANAYRSESDVDRMYLLRDRQAADSNIDTLIGYTSGSTFDVSVTKKLLSGQLCDLSQMTSSGDYSGLTDKLTEITLNLNRMDVATSQESDFSAAKSTTESEIARIQGSIGGVTESLYSGYTGYFISSADGYEDIRNESYFESLSAEEGESVIASGTDYSTGADVYGKVITDYKWSICTYVDTAQAENLSVGKSVNVSISVPDNKYYKGTVTKLADKGDKTLVTVQCTIMDSESRSKRITDCEILFKQYSGIKIPKTALHFEDVENDDGSTRDAMGVYVVYSNVVEFKCVTPVYEDENYIIVPLTYESGVNEVKLYDSIIVKGRNLYDGKYL